MTQDSEPESDDPARDAADAVIDELNRRKGFDYWWDDIDADIQEGIRQALADEIREVYSDDG